MRKLIENMEKGEMSEAAPVTREELNKDQQKIIKEVEKITGSKAYNFFFGISGAVADLTGKYGVRLDSKDLSRLSRIVRWIEPSGDSMSVGF